MSRQFDVFEHPSAPMRRRYPYFIVLQHESIAKTDNLIIAPLVGFVLQPFSRAYPLLNLRGSTVMMLTPDLAVIPRRVLKQPIANMSDQRYGIITAIDLLFVGSRNPTRPPCTTAGHRAARPARWRRSASLLR